MSGEGEGVEEVWMRRLGGSHRGGGCSQTPEGACGARAEDAALSKLMLIPLSPPQSRHLPGGQERRGCRGGAEV